MTNLPAPLSDHARALAASAAEKASSGSKNIKAIMEGRSDVFRLNPYSIKPVEGFNLRDFDAPDRAEKDEALARNIALEGVQTALKVRSGDDGYFLIVDGERRWRATLRAINEFGAEIETIPVTMVGKGQNDADLIAAQFTSNMGDPFSELEQAEGVRRLRGYGWPTKKIMERGGLNDNKFARLVHILELPEAAKTMIREGQVSPTLALDTVKSSSTSEQAVKALQEGRERATEAGARKVTARHVARTGGGSVSVSPASALSELRTVFRQAEIERDGEFTTFRLSDAGAEAVQRLLGV